MNSEKVKEIKECLQSCNDDKMACYDCKYYEKCEKILTKNNILTLINKLESGKENLYNLNQNLISDRQVLINENERLKDEVKVRQGFIEDYKIVCDKKDKENKQLKDRIAELEKENKDYYDRLNNLQTYIDNHEEIWKGNTNNALKQFAERLIEKKVKLGERFNIYDIDETLKEYEK